jgi:hypothetical protein
VNIQKPITGNIQNFFKSANPMATVIQKPNLRLKPFKICKLVWISNLGLESGPFDIQTIFSYSKICI